MVPQMSKRMVIGIDGVPYELLKAFTGDGTMPETKRLADRFGLRRTHVPLPEISSVSWTSFMTGMNPGEHGVYGFMEINRANYSYTFPSFRTLPVKTIWEEWGERGKRSVVLNLPSTYPARPLEGMLVSGFVALDLAKAVYPASLLPELEAMEYEVDVDTAVARSSKELFLNELHRGLENRYRLFRQLDSREEWDLFYFIITGTDRLHHFLFDAFMDEASAYNKGFRDYYRAVDAIIGEIAAEMEKRGIPVIILSDHGFTGLKQEVYISRYLEEWGYLYLEDPQPKNIKSITEKTSVFALDPSRLYIHLEGKYGRGRVKQKDYDRLREEVKTRFLELKIDGESVVKEVYYKEDIYHGPYFENAPDLVLLSHYGYDLKSGVTKKERYGKSYFTGMHTRDNAVLIDGSGLDLPDNPGIVDVGRGIRFTGDQ